MENQFLNDMPVARTPYLYDHAGNPLLFRSPNLDPTFFFGPNSTGQITTGTIEEKPYQYHAWAYACAWAIARNLSKLRLKIVKRDNEDQTVDDNAGVLKLLRRPNPLQTRSSFLQYLIINLVSRKGKDGGGQVFIVPSQKGGINFDFSKEKDVPDALFAFTDQFFEPDLTPTDNGLKRLGGWKFEINGEPKSKKTYTAEELIRIYLTNPYNMLEGLSPLEPAGVALTMDIQADLYNSRMYENNAIPAGILKAKGQLTKEQRRDNMRAWYNMMGGAAKTQKIAMLDSELDYTHIGLTNVDMQYAEMMDNTLEKILATYGLNKIALGMYESLNFATIKEGRKLLWHDAYMPIAEILIEQINNQWLYYLDDSILLAWDTSHIEALQPDYSKKSESLLKMTQAKVPVKVAARILDIPLTEQDLKDYPHLSEKPETAGPIMPVPDADNNDDDDKKTAGGAVIKAPDKIGRFDLFWSDMITNVFDPGEKEYRREFEKYFYSQRNRMQDKVDEWAKENKAVRNIRAAAVTPKMFLLDEIDENAKMKKTVKPLIKKTLARSAANLEKELGELINFNVSDPMLDAYTAKRMSKLKLVNVETNSILENELKETITAGIKENLTVNEMSANLKDTIGKTMDSRIKGRTLTIARTETSAVINESRFDAFKQEGIENHEWIAAIDENTRDLHNQTNGVVVKVGDIFWPVGLRYPLDDSGPQSTAGNTINCRCVVVAVFKEGTSLIYMLGGEPFVCKEVDRD